MHPKFSKAATLSGDAIGVATEMLPTYTGFQWVSVDATRRRQPRVAGEDARGPDRARPRAQRPPTSQAPVFTETWYYQAQPLYGFSLSPVDGTWSQREGS